MRLTASTRGGFNSAHVRRALGDGIARALKKSGMVVQEKTQRGMSNRTPLAKPRMWKITQKDGSDLVAEVNKIPKSDRVTSWKTPRSPKGFLRSDIRYDISSRTQSAVVGPSRYPKVNQLNEFGGSKAFYFIPTYSRSKPSRKYKKPTYGYLTNKPSAKAIHTFTRNVKPRRFMEQGLTKAMPQIPAQFKDTVRGP
jgi:hypothetical protein